MLASGSYAKIIKVWNTVTHQEITTLRGHTACINSVCFSPNMNILVSPLRRIK